MQTKRIHTHRLVYFLIAACFVALLVGLVISNGQVKTGPKVRVAATIFPVYDLVRNIGGSDITVDLLLPGGNLPEQLPKIYALTDLSSYAAIFGVGHGLDDTGLGTADLTTLDNGINLLLEDNTTGSPYYWLSLYNAERMAQNAAAELIRLDPRHAPNYQKRLRVLQSQIRELDGQINPVFAGLLMKNMAVIGEDWSYFASDYGLNVVAWAPVREGVVTESDTEMVKDSMKALGLTTVFTSVLRPFDGINPITSMTAFTMVPLDAYGGIEDRQSYLELMRSNAFTIADSLRLGPFPLREDEAQL